MSKFYRSLLWSGVLAAGVAACGDDVTIPTPPPPVLTVHSVSVAPNGVSLQVGNTLPMQASVNADATVPTTVTWSVNVAGTIATINASSGLLTAVGVGSVAVQACSTFNTSVCGNATINIVTNAPPAQTVTAVNVTPPSVIVAKPPAAGTSTQQFSAAVLGTNNPSQSVTWSIVGGPITGLSISTTGLLTVTSAVLPGTTSASVSACSQVVGFTTICGFGAVSFTSATPATVSLGGVTWIAPAGPATCTPGAGGPVPIVLTNVRCQIEVTANVNAGDIQLSRMDIVMANTCSVPPNVAGNCSASGNTQVMATHIFPGTVAAQDGEPAGVSAPVSITLSINTTQVRSPTNSASNLVPAIFNGNANIQLVLYTAAGQQAAASTPFGIVMNNIDAIRYPSSLVNTTNTPVGGFTTGGVTFFTGTQTTAGAQYIAFSQVAPNSSASVPASAGFTSTLAGCGPSSLIVTGTPTTGITLSGVFTCAGVQGSNTVSNAAIPGFAYALAIGPDGTAIQPPLFYSSVGSAFCLPVNGAATVGACPPATATAELRWNLLLQNGAPVPLPTQLTAVGVDNKAPTVTIGNVAFNDLFDQPWVNAAYLFSQDISASDVGGSGVALLQAHDFVGIVCTARVVTSPGPLTPVAADGYPETLTSDGSPEGFRICSFATDNVGNSASSGGSNFFGVDKVAPVSRLAGTTAATPTFAGLGITVPAVSSVANTTIYSIAAPFPATDRWGLEAQDTRSGFNQNAVALFPANETMARLAPAVNPTAVIPCGFTAPLGTPLSDNFVRSSHIPAAALDDCGLGAPNPGYFFFNGLVTDRAGNQAPLIVRNYAIDQYFAPVLTSVGPGSIFYTAGTPGAFFLFGSDDLEIIDANLTLAYPGMNAVTATLVGVTKPLSSIVGCARWDATLCNILAGASATDPYLFGRVDLTCTGAATPYASCLVADTPAPTAAQNNNVDTDGDTVFEDDDKNPTGVSAVAFDVASQASNTVASGLLTAQTNDVAQQWGAGADIVTWRVTSTAGTTVIAEHKASTSITAPYFDFVYLARANAGATALVICSQFPQNPVVNPVLTDNGLFRFWTYTASKPSGTAPCATGGSWYAVGVKAGAALVTIGLP